MHILLPSDVFPPGSVGGAAWSTHALACALMQRGHTVTVVVPEQTENPPPQPISRAPAQDTLGVPTIRYPYYAPRLPFVQNYYRHERLWHPLANLLTHLVQQAGQREVVIHAQHVQTIPAAVIAGQRLRVPVAAVVRDHWPWDYFATGLHGNQVPYQIRAGMTEQWCGLATDLVARMGAAKGLLALPAIPYMLMHVKRRAAMLAQANAVLAVSGYVAGKLANIVPAERLHVMPNMVNIAAVERIASTPLETPVEEPFLLYIGKLERNKGAALLPEIFRALRAYRPEVISTLPTLVIAGSGTLRATLEENLAIPGVRTQFLSWVSHEEILRLMARCRLLLFPSLWGEPLSRVLLEASALGAPILAMPTGGTPDIITSGVNGVLARTPAQFVWHLARLLQDEPERHRLSEQAKQVARQRFSVEAVLPQVERLYTTMNVSD